jgi:HTH-like domain
MRRQRPFRIAQHDQRLLPRIRSLKADHPFWGYRRIWAYLRFVEALPVNKKRILRLMREHHLLVSSHLKPKAKRTPRCNQVASATRGRIGQVSEPNQTRRAPNACFRTAGASRAIAGS